MARHDGFGGIQEALELGKRFVEVGAENAFLNMKVAKNPYESQVTVLNAHTMILSLFGANRCLRMSSMVHMADGTKKELKEVEVDDMVLAYDWAKASLVPSRVNGVHFNNPCVIQRYRHDDGILECTRSHKVLYFTKKGTVAWCQANRAVKRQHCLVTIGPAGAPRISTLEFIESIDAEPTMDLTIDHPDHSFVCDGIVVSNSGKSHTGAYKVAWDATGLYPDWYTGPKTERGIDCWVLGDTNENTRDNCQKKLFGPDPERPGWTDKPGDEALIHTKYIVGKPSRRSQPSGAFDQVRVKHVPSDTTSTISLKSHSMDRQALASWHGKLVWIDEECRKEILDELVARVMDEKGQIIITLCPIDGMTPVVNFLLTAPADIVTMAVLDWEQATHLDSATKEQIKRLWASDPAMLKARTQGIATQNSGLIFPFPLSKILYDPRDISISSRWKFMGGYDPGWRHPTGASALALDPLSDVAYLYATYAQSEKPYFYHHGQLLNWGENMTFMIDPAGMQAGQATGERVLEQLWKMAHGEAYEEIPEECRKYIRANNDFHLGMDEMWNRMNTGRLRINKNCADWQTQYTSYVWDKLGKGPREETDQIRFDILTSSRYAIMGLEKHAHRLDETPPWDALGDMEATIVPPDWKPYRAGA
jgi:hypothetical protein